MLINSGNRSQEFFRDFRPSLQPFIQNRFLIGIFVYEGAGHAFNRDVDPGHYNAAAAKLARERTLAFLKSHIA